MLGDISKGVCNKDGRVDHDVDRCLTFLLARF